MEVTSRMFGCVGGFHAFVWLPGQSGQRIPKWWVYFIEKPIKMDVLGIAPIIGGTPHMIPWIEFYSWLSSFRCRASPFDSVTSCRKKSGWILWFMVDIIQGLGLMSLVADVFHITKTNIIKYLLERKWTLYPLPSWVMWKHWDINLNPCWYSCLISVAKHDRYNYS